MNCLIDLTLTPRDGWNYIHPVTGVRIQGGSYRDWKNKVREHDLANGLPIGSLWEWEAQDALCSQKPENFCRECIPTGETFTAAPPPPTAKGPPCRRGCGGGRAR